MCALSSKVISPTVLRIHSSRHLSELVLTTLLGKVQMKVPTGTVCGLLGKQTMVTVSALHEDRPLSFVSSHPMPLACTAT